MGLTEGLLVMDKTQTRLVQPAALVCGLKSLQLSIALKNLKDIQRISCITEILVRFRYFLELWN